MVEDMAADKVMAVETDLVKEEEILDSVVDIEMVVDWAANKEEYFLDSLDFLAALRFSLLTTLCLGTEGKRFHS
jgi:hypothetical protein